MNTAFDAGDWPAVVRLMSDHFGLGITLIRADVKRPVAFPGLRQSFIQMPEMRSYWWDNDEGFYEEPRSYPITKPWCAIYCPLAIDLQLEIKL